MGLRIATDIGGTFTDLVAIDDRSGELIVAKARSTPDAFEKGVLEVIDRADFSRGKAVEAFVHGSTVVINTLVERTGTRTALVTTAGFRDVVEIGRGNRPDLFNLRFRKPRPFIERCDRYEIIERVDYRGRIITPLDEASVIAVARRMKTAGIGAVAICLLHSYANPDHEQLCAEIIKTVMPDVEIAASHEITQEWREYERALTAGLNAYVMGTTSRYLARLASELESRFSVGRGRYVMQSSGGTTSFQRAMEMPIALVESGPVGGVLGAATLGQLLDVTNVISLDIGGTTAKTSLIENGEVRVTTEYKLNWRPDFPGYPIRVPVVDIVEIGAGGGSIAWFDEAGSLRVGPRSAGAAPGPACYPNGGADPTVTDANLVCGRIDPEYFLGGEIGVSVERARTALMKIGSRLGVSDQEAALGVIRIANANMVNALKAVTTFRGYDPRNFTLIAFGGGGSMHAGALAMELQVKRIIVPQAAAAFSAWGMLTTDLRADWVRTCILPADDGHIDRTDALWAELEGKARRYFEDQSLTPLQVRLARFADMRYCGQEHTVKVPLHLSKTVMQGSPIDTFHELHERAYTFRLDSPVEYVNFHLVAFGVSKKPQLSEVSARGRARRPTPASQRIVDFDSWGRHSAAIYERDNMPIEQPVEGPAVIEDPAASTVVFPGQMSYLDKYGNVWIELS